MKKGIHPAYHPSVTASCRCGAKFTVGSTLPEIEVEVCSACHPFFTGEKKVFDTGGRVERFKKRQEAVSKTKK